MINSKNTSVKSLYIKIDCRYFNIFLINNLVPQLPPPVRNYPRPILPCMTILIFSGDLGIYLTTSAIVNESQNEKGFTLTSCSLNGAKEWHFLVPRVVFTLWCLILSKSFSLSQSFTVKYIDLILWIFFVQN